jgi:hypothetical protein
MMAASMVSARPQPLQAASGVPFEKLREVVTRNCAGCHFKGFPASRVIALDELVSSPERSMREELSWRKVYARVLVSRSMPPAESGISLSDDDRATIRDWIEGNFRLSLASASRGATLRRLTNYEYNRSIRDLFGFDFDVGSHLQKDNSNEGFTNNAAVMFPTPERARQYFAASQFVARTALGVNDALVFRGYHWSAYGILAENPNRGKWTAFGRWVQDRLSRVKRTDPLPSLDLTTIKEADGKSISAIELSEGSSFGIRHEFPVSGDYRITLRGAADHPRKTAAVDIAIDGVAVPFAIHLSPHSEGLKDYPLSSWIPRGKRSLKISMRSREQALVASIEIEGPVLERIPSQNGRPAFVSRLPCIDPDESNLTPRDCADRTIHHLALKAFRTDSIDESDVQTLLLPFQTSLNAGNSFPAALSLSVQALLLDPRFLYRIESSASSADISDFEFASRLSYFLWASLPDEELRDLASRRALMNSPETVRAQVARMLADPRADAMVDAFADGWLGFSSLKHHVVDTRTFPQFDEELRQAMLVETRTFLKDFFLENRPVSDLIASRSLYVNERLARHYGIAGIRGPAFLRIESPTDQRVGLLTHGSILTVTSSSYRTSVVKRGYWMLDRMLCETIDPPPPDVPALEESSRPGRTLREEMEQHRANPVCATCHRRMDPVGFSLENYDGTGAWRTHDAGVAINASGEFSTPAGPARFQSFVQLRESLKDDPRIPSCATKKLMTYALGRRLTSEDANTIAFITAKTQPTGYRIQDTIAEIALSAPFRMRQP